MVAFEVIAYGEDELRRLPLGVLRELLAASKLDLIEERRAIASSLVTLGRAADTGVSGSSISRHAALLYEAMDLSRERRAFHARLRRALAQPIAMGLLAALGLSFVDVYGS